jgi:hypothetical protein
MSFKDVYNALYDQISTDSNLLVYVDSGQFYKGFTENAPVQEYSVFLEPGDEEEIDDTEVYGYKIEYKYLIDIHVRVALIADTIGSYIVGNDNKKGILEFCDDIKAAIKADRTLNYDRSSYSESAANAGSTFVLSGSEKYISVSINSRTPQGYNTILCGDSSLSGASVASNIQTALRALGNHADDGYYDATCTFDGTSNKFKIEVLGEHPDWTVEVTAGASDDCSSLLGFDNPTEEQGRNITKIEFGNVYPNNVFFPVRYRIIPVRITEEVNNP